MISECLTVCIHFCVALGEQQGAEARQGDVIATLVKNGVK